jgi:ribosome biogenesis GTPase
LINRLYGDSVQEVGEIRETDSKGRHITTTRELILLPSGGLVIDTPGLREFHLWSGSEGLAETFNDIAALAAGCRFNDCAHDREPGCAVRAAVDAGRVDAARVSHFRKLKEEASAVGERQRRKPDPPKRRDHDLRDVSPFDS